MIDSDKRPSYIVAQVPTSRVRKDWRDYVKTEEDYDSLMASGMAYVYFPDIPNWVEFKEYLNNKEDK